LFVRAGGPFGQGRSAHGRAVLRLVVWMSPAALCAEVLNPALTMIKQLIEAPTSDSSHRYETLAYVDAYDAVLNCDYAFVAYKETHSWGESRVRIKSSQTAGAVFEPASMRSKAREATAQGKSWFPWGYSFDPTPADPRSIQFRVHVANGQPNEVELFVQLRKFDGSADEAKTVRFAWPSL
jgi:hypothetical protein